MKKIVLNYIFVFLLMTLTLSGFVTAFDLDPGDSGNGTGSDTTPPYVAIRNPTGGIISQNTEVKVVASDLEGLDKVKIYVDNVLKTTSYSGTTYYSWDIGSYDDGSTHTVKAKAYDDAGNTRTVSKSYIIGYTEDTQHYLHSNGYTGENEDDLGTIAYMKIESDLFGLIMLIEGDQVLIIDDDLLVSYFDVTMMYYCKDNHRLDYNLDPTERPLTAPHGTLVELNFEMEETNVNLADYSLGEVRDSWIDDRLFWPNFGTPDGVAASNAAIYVLSKTIGILVSYLDITRLAAFAIDITKDFILEQIKAGDEDPFTTGAAGANPVDITYRNLCLNDQSVLYPENNYNYAYDAISRHRILFEYKRNDDLIGQTLGLKFRCNAEYADSRTDSVETIFSNWVMVEFLLN